MKRKTRLWIRFILTLLLAGGVYLILRNYEQEHVYSPSPFISKTPRDAQLAFDSVAMVSDDGVNIQGWYVQAPEPGVTNPPTGPVLLFFHGKTGNMSDYLDRIHLFHDMGLDVFAIDYHGYGKSGGSPTERALQGDALAAYFHLTQKRGVKPEQIFLYGQDIGGAVAIDLAVRALAAGLIVEGTPASILRKVSDDWPLIPWEYLLVNQFDSQKRIGEVHIPVLILHSSDDEVVPFDDGRRLDIMAHDPKEFVELHGTHHGAFEKSFDTYYDTIERFVHDRLKKNKSTSEISSTETNAPASKEATP